MKQESSFALGEHSGKTDGYSPDAKDNYKAVSIKADKARGTVLVCLGARCSNCPRGSLEASNGFIRSTPDIRGTSNSRG